MNHTKAPSPFRLFHNGQSWKIAIPEEKIYSSLTLFYTTLALEIDSFATSAFTQYSLP